MKLLLLVVTIALCFFTFSFVEQENFQCVQGIRYQENNCNNCWCDNGHLSCTLMACLSHQDPKYKDCEAGTTWTEGCNQCYCLEDLGTLCYKECEK